MERRLAAVLAADMAGSAITKNQGNIIKTTGDGMLVEFQSVADAVKCAAEIQERMQRRNSDVSEDRRIEFRIGINLGDIIFQDDDIFGDGVNIAARLEGLAEIGGFCVTAAVYDQVSDRVEIGFEDLGDKSLKNINRPIRVYRAVMNGPVRDARAGANQLTTNQAVVKPTVAVLPFANMSGDAEQEFFVDGLTEDILTELSRRHELFVISRNSTFVYKGQAVNIPEGQCAEGG
jgi:adenylate cyclase